MSQEAPSWVSRAHLAIALWLVYIVLGFFVELALYLLVRALWPEMPIHGGPLSLNAILIIQLAGVAVLPGLMFSILRRQRRFLLGALLVPIAATVFTFVLLSVAGPEIQGQIHRLMEQVLPRVWIGTLVVVAYAYDRRNLPGVCN